MILYYFCVQVPCCSFPEKFLKHVSLIYLKVPLHLLYNFFPLIQILVSLEVHRDTCKHCMCGFVCIVTPPEAFSSTFFVKDMLYLGYPVNH